MIRYFKKIILFSIPFFIGVIIVFLLPYSKEFAYNYRNNVDCNTSWIYYRLFQNTAPIDVAFLGTSHTGCGINDSLIEGNLNELNRSYGVANLAYCTNGRNIQYPLLRDLLLTKKPKIIIVEVSEEESKSSHQDFPYLADLKDIFQPTPRLDLMCLQDIYTAFSSRFMFFRKRITNTLEIKAPSNYLNNHNYVPFNFFAEEDVLKKHQENQMNKYKLRNDSWVTKIQKQYPKKYLKKMVELSEQNNVKLVFLYVPSYGASLKLPVEYNFYKELGDVWIPPNSIFTNPVNWVDHEHLNSTGSTELSKWVSRKVIDEY